MRFLLTTPSDTKGEAAPPDPRLMAAIGELSEELTNAGVLLESGGLSSKSVRLRLARGKIDATDGPFVEAKEVIGGYAIIEAKSREEAIELGRRFLQVHADVLGPSYRAESEIRRVFGPADFAPPGQS